MKNIREVGSCLKKVDEVEKWFTSEVRCALRVKWINITSLLLSPFQYTASEQFKKNKKTTTNISKSHCKKGCINLFIRLAQVLHPGTRSFFMYAPSATETESRYSNRLED